MTKYFCPAKLNNTIESKIKKRPNCCSTNLDVKFMPELIISSEQWHAILFRTKYTGLQKQSFSKSLNSADEFRH